jgi:hypothetical protein
MAAGRRWAVGKASGRSGQVHRGAERKHVGLGACAQALIFLLGVAAFAQSSPPNGLPGALSGKLTDLHSHPVPQALLILRNTATGVQARAITLKDGSYRFSGLAPGEYTLDAGPARVEGIFIAPGHESRVQAALALDTSRNAGPSATVPGAASTQDDNRSALRLSSSPGPAPIPETNTPLAIAIAQAPHMPASQADKPPVITVPVKAQLSVESARTLPLVARSVAEPLPVPASAAIAPSQSKEAGDGPSSPADEEPAVRAEVAILAAPVARAPRIDAFYTAGSKPAHAAFAAIVLNSAGWKGASLAAAGVSAAHFAAQMGVEQPRVAVAMRASDPRTPEPALSGQQLQALPLSGRHWENFVLDAAPAGTGMEEVGRQAAVGMERTSGGSISVDSASIRLAFGGRGAGPMRRASLMGPGSNEAAILEVRPYANSGVSPDNAGVETRAGGDGLHGQGFLFDRRNLWGARNPFTQWVKKTTPASVGAMPAFAPIPYTAPDNEDRWGFGLGGRIRRRQLSWFAAWDGSVRNDPGLATVRHPDNFFAQPANDEMQVLSARLGLSSVNPIAEGLAAYSGMLETLGGLLGPAARTANQWAGFGRLDWRAAERHRFTLEGTGARSDSPGGGLTRVAEPFGSHSFGTSRASELWLLGRWEAFVTPNLLAVTQGSAGRHVLAEGANAPSPFEQTLNVNAWGQLPQIVVDSRYGFTIGNPSRFGRGSYPDERLYEVQQAVDWVHGGLLIKSGVDWRHNADATSMLRNHTGTYHYSTVENFASDALVFAKYGMSGALDPFDQHNCDQRGRAWRDSTHQLRGLGYLPCYSWYSQTMGPTNWNLSTNDMAAYVTAQWQPAKRLVMSAALRWEREYLPPPIALVDNPALPLTRKVPSPGNEWGPRLSLAWGSGESRWPVVHAGYGMYFGRTQNSVLETALTQTGSMKGDLNFFMRPTDNLTGGGAPPFPYVLAGEPSTVVKPGAVEFAPAFRNPEIHQGEVTVEEQLPGHVHVAASAVASLGRRLPVIMDTNFNPDSNPGTITYGVVDGLNAGPIKARQITVPFFASWPAPGSATGTAGRLNSDYQQIAELISKANSTYGAAMLRVSRMTRRGIGFHARYTYAHAMDWNPNESTLISGSSLLDPLDFGQEYGTSNLDIRHAVSGMLIWQAPWKLKGMEGRMANGWMLSGIGQFHSGLPFTMRTAGSIPEEFTTAGAVIAGLGPSMNGYGGDNRVYGVSRNTYRYPFTWKADVRLGKKFSLGQMRELELMAESFNLFNHQNVTRLETVGYYISPGSVSGSLPTLNFLTGLKTGQTEFGKPLDVNATDFFQPRQFDFGMRVRF